MDQDTYKKMLMEVRISKVELKQLIKQFPTVLVLELDSHGVARQRKAINQSMSSLDREISHLVLDLKAKGSAQDALRIENVELMGKKARKEYVDYKAFVYEAFTGYMEKDFPEFNEVIPRSDEDEASCKWYSITSLYNYEALYNVDPENLKRS